MEKPPIPGCIRSKTPIVPIKTAKVRRQPIFSLKRNEENSKTKMGEVNKPAAASAIGIIGITLK